MGRQTIAKQNKNSNAKKRESEKETEKTRTNKLFPKRLENGLKTTLH